MFDCLSLDKAVFNAFSIRKVPYTKYTPINKIVICS